MRVPLTVIILCVGLLMSAGVYREHDPLPQPRQFVDPLSAPGLEVHYASGQIRIAGSSASGRHENALRRLVAEHFPGVAADFDFAPALLPGPGWETASARLVYLVAASESAVASLQPDAADIRAVTSRPDVFESRAAFLREALSAAAVVSTDAVVVTASANLDDLCARAFESLELQPVSFHESSAEIRMASIVTLDRITEFARDCQSARIGIRGHTDASGNEAWNRKLSLARAQAVADHLIASGIDPERLVVSGLGSSEPIADNTTARGREANRRIEFELL